MLSKIVTEVRPCGDATEGLASLAQSGEKQGLAPIDHGEVRNDVDQTGAVSDGENARISHQDVTHRKKVCSRGERVNPARGVNRVAHRRWWFDWDIWLLGHGGLVKGRLWL